MSLTGKDDSLLRSFRPRPLVLPTTIQLAAL